MDYNNAVISMINVEDLKEIINELSLLNNEKTELSNNNSESEKIEKHLCKKDNLYKKFLKLQFNTVKKAFNNEEDMKNFLRENISTIFTDHEMEAIYKKERKNLEDYVKNNFDPNKLAMQNFSFWLDENGDRHYSAEISELCMDFPIDEFYSNPYNDIEPELEDFNEDNFDMEEIPYNEFIEENDIKAENTVDSITNYLKNNSENYDKVLDNIVSDRSNNPDWLKDMKDIKDQYNMMVTKDTIAMDSIVNYLKNNKDLISKQLDCIIYDYFEDMKNKYNRFDLLNKDEKEKNKENEQKKDTE